MTKCHLVQANPVFMMKTTGPTKTSKLMGGGGGRKEEVRQGPPMTKTDKLKYGCFVTMVMLLWVSLVGVSLWSLDLVRQSIKIVQDP